MKPYLALAALALLSACGPLAPDAPKKAEKKATLSLTLLPQEALVPGRQVTVLAKVNDIQQRVSLTDADLDTVQGETFHLLVLDSGFADYQHLHPRQVSPGLYSVQFTPKSTDGYRAWADVTPRLTHKQEFAAGELGNPRKKPIDKTETREANAGGYRFSLNFDKAPAVGEESTGTLRITHAGQSVMAAETHIVAFHEDYRTALRAQPMSDGSFRLSPTKTGFFKLFAQVKIDGKEYVVPFGVMIGK